MVELPSTVVDSKDIGRVRYRYLPGNCKYCHTGGTKEFPTLADFQGNFQKTLFTRARRFPSEFPETYAQGNLDGMCVVTVVSSILVVVRPYTMYVGVYVEDNTSGGGHMF